MMLLQFNFKNFKSFKDDTILDFSATKITEHSNRLFSIGEEKILPIAAIYGANASGKSNVISAYHFMETYVVNSFAYGGESEDKKTVTKKIKLTPFLFDAETKQSASTFEVFFTSKENSRDKIYNYGFSLGYNGVEEEWLNCKSKSATKYRRIFYRSKQELDLSGLPKVNKDSIQVSLENETLVVSLGAKLKISQLKFVRDWFYKNNFVDFGDPIANVFLSSMIPKDFADDKAVQDKVISYFASFDTSIIGFNVEEQKRDDDKKTYKIEAIHKMTNGATTTLPLKEESAGTLKMFAFFPALQDTLENGSVLFVDELNARLHPLLVRNIIITFLSKEINNKGAQLIFTTHDPWQLSTNLLRRDEIWFTEKNKEGISILYSLADFVDEDGVKIRKDENYEKNYLLGKYGAIPSLNGLDMFKEN